MNRHGNPGTPHGPLWFVDPAQPHTCTQAPHRNETKTTKWLTVACSVLAWGWVGACFCFHQERLAFVEPRVGCTTNNTANITNTAELQGGVSSPPHPYRLDNTPTTASAE